MWETSFTIADTLFVTVCHRYVSKLKIPVRITGIFNLETYL